MATVRRRIALLWHALIATYTFGNAGCAGESDGGGASSRDNAGSGSVQSAGAAGDNGEGLGGASGALGHTAGSDNPGGGGGSPSSGGAGALAGAGVGASAGGEPGGTSGGSSNAGSGGIAGGTAGSSNGIRDGELGSACESDMDCDGDLECVLALAESSSGNGPAGGLCTVPCVQGRTTCAAFGEGGACVYLDDTNAYCLESCAFGAPVGAAAKCHAREDVACALVYDAEPQSSVCNDTEDCPQGFECASGFCYAVATACVPQCNADTECGPGRFCDFATPFSTFGLCHDNVPSGAVTGEACTGGSSECRGRCLGLSDAVAVCGDGCTFGSPAACSGSGTHNAAACLHLPYPDQGEGDAGSCIQLCDCPADCLHPGLVCLAFPADSNTEITRSRSGYCYLPREGESGISCP